jgi:hypothetical protein
MNKTRVLTIIIIIGIINIIISGCGKKVESVKDNADIVKEYNNSIAVYNKLALTFTRLARIVDNEIKQSSDFDERFWHDFIKMKSKVDDNIEKIENLKIKHKEIEIIIKDIELFIDDIKKYIDYIHSFKQKEKTSSNITQLKLKHEEIYDELIRQSNNIVKVFDDIYNQKIINKK